MRAIGDDDVDRRVGDAERRQILEPALAKIDVGSRETEALGLRRLMAARHRQLLGGHVDADDPAARTDQPRDEVGVAPGAAAEIENRAAFQAGRDRRAAAVEAVEDFRSISARIA